MPNCYGYIRVSHEEQVAQGHSLAAQETKIRAAWEKDLKPLGVEFGGLFIDRAVSAFKHPFPKRPEAANLLVALRPGDHVLFAMHDRAFRSMIDCCNTMHALTQSLRVNVRILNLPDNDGPAGRAFLHMMMTFAEMESGMKSLRIREAFREAQRQGKHISPKRPPGKKIVGKKGAYYLEDDPLERAVMGEIVKLRDVQRLSWEQISISIESRLAEYEGRRFTTSAFCKRAWSKSRCLIAYRHELRHRAHEAEMSAP